MCAKTLLIAARLWYNKGMVKIKLKPHFGKVSAILAAVCFALAGLDILLKYLEEAQGWNFTVIPGFIWVESGHRNDGAAFSSFAGSTAFLIAFSVILSIVVAAAFVFLEDRHVLLKTGLSMVLGGALGNLYDRIFFAGEVRDFVWVNMLFTNACCNFADFFIVFGVIVILVDFVFLNEWALIPLTKKAKAAQKREREAEDKDGRDEGGGQ